MVSITVFKLFFMIKVNGAVPAVIFALILIVSEDNKL
jgi:hypothetical protein